MADNDDAPPNPNPKPSICEGCRSNPWKYRCPGCSFHSCSLPCVQSHKQRTGCTGKRPLAQSVPIGSFDDNLLLADYSFLEDAKRVADSARRTISRFGSTVRFPLLPHLKILRDVAKRRGTRLFVLPRGMERRDKNQTNFNRRFNRIYWTVEWKFHMADVSLIDHGVGEHLYLSSAIEKHLEPSPWNSKLRPYFNVKLDDLKFFVKKNAMITKSKYLQLDARAPIRSQLKNVIILEYPVIYVYLPSETYNFEVIGVEKRSTKYNESSKLADADSNPNVKLFREEEIEEGEVPFETQVVDLLHNRSSEKGSSSQLHGDGAMKKEDCYPDKQIQVIASEDSRASLVSRHLREMEEQLLEDEKFDFEQEVKDAYSDLIGQVDPDEFLCFDGDFGDLPSSFFEDLLTVDELEEGEIPS